MPDKCQSKMNTNNTLTAIIIVFVAIVAWYLITKTGENFENLRILNVPKRPYSEPNLNCDLGARDCRLSTGPSGTCDYKSRKCVELPYSAPQKVYKGDSLSPPIGEPSSECQWRGVCNRMNNEMGVCMSGLCYPTTHIVR